jgi:hypothetical protein
MKLKRVCIVWLTAFMLVAVLATGASAKSAPVTKMMFKLGQHSFVVGDTVSASVSVMSRLDHHWVGIPGATIVVTVDGTEVGTFAADDTGVAVLSWVADTEGEHVMKVLYAGDELHKRTQRAQGFSVTVAPAA